MGMHARQLAVACLPHLLNVCNGLEDVELSALDELPGRLALSQDAPDDLQPAWQPGGS